MAIAETTTGDAQAPGSGQPPIALEAQTGNIDVGGQGYTEALQTFAAGKLAAEADADVGANAGKSKAEGDIAVTVGFASESNAKKDIYVGMTYNDNFFENSSFSGHRGSSVAC